ncbi:MAG: tetratricopeptide repeat protein [Candidatus Eisenbacteria bacterium]|nr:tetratricopeptide repeat protein [Candidatus Eisenbacteria bacterium]
MRYCIEDAAQMLKARDFDGAETALRSLINADPRDAVAYNVLGLVHLERRRYAEAIASFSQAIRLRSPYPEALINLAVACNRTGEHELAIKVSDLALAAAPGSVAALLNRGMACKGPSPARRSEAGVRARGRSPDGALQPRAHAAARERPRARPAAARSAP